MERINYDETNYELKKRRHRKRICQFEITYIDVKVVKNFCTASECSIASECNKCLIREVCRRINPVHN